MTQNYYEAIGLSPTGVNPETKRAYTVDELKLAYRKTARECADATLLASRDSPQFTKLQNANIAYAELKDLQRRAEYDSWLKHSTAGEAYTGFNAYASSGADKPKDDWEELLREAIRNLRETEERKWRDKNRKIEQELRRIFVKNLGLSKRADSAGRTIQEQLMYEHYKSENLQLIAMGIFIVVGACWLGYLVANAAGYRLPNFLDIGKTLMGWTSESHPARPNSPCKSNAHTDCSRK